MRYLIFAMLMLTGCSTVPYSIEDIHVREKFKILRGTHQGCEISVNNIATMHFHRCNDLINEETVCGSITCADRVRTMVYEPLTCLPFEAIREDRPDPLHLEMGRQSLMAP